MWEQHVASEGSYDISKHRESFVFEGVSYTYHNSGLARQVYKSECGKFVIKVPIVDYEEHEELQADFREGYATHPAISHNLGEAEAYKQCPDEFKKYLAHTELLPNGWVKQEFVEVLYTYTGSHEFREIGRREDGSYCIFDYDPILRDFEFIGYRWEHLPEVVKVGIEGIK